MPLPAPRGLLRREARCRFSPVSPLLRNGFGNTQVALHKVEQESRFRADSVYGSINVGNLPQPSWQRFLDGRGEAIPHKREPLPHTVCH